MSSAQASDPQASASKAGTDGQVKSNGFDRFWRKGYRRLCPVIPPKAPVGERSSLFKRIAAGDDARGKAPGVKWPGGTWSGFDFVACESTEADIDRWSEWGASVGIKTGLQPDGTTLLLIDADTVDEDHAAVIRERIAARFGQLPVRIGRPPKAGYLVRVRGEFAYARIEFGERDAKGRLKDRVEILSEGRQFVCEGIHPGTGLPYDWPEGVPALDDVPIVEADDLTGLLEELRPLLPAAGEIVREGAGSKEPVDPERLRGDPELVRRAVAATPNTSAIFPSRESYRDYGYAIKAALPDDPDLAFELFADWAERWVDPPPGKGNDADVVEGDWKRMKPPFRRGAGWLYEIAEMHGGGAFSAAERWALPNDTAGFFPNPFETAGAMAIDATPYRFPDPAGLPRREWLYGGHYIRRFVSATVAPSGVGKSSLGLAEALAMASGKPILGVQPKDAARVWVWNGEDPLEELERRVAACMMLHGLTREDIGDRLLLDSGRDMPMVIAHDTREGCVIRRPVVTAVLKAMDRHAVDALVIDPFVSSHMVSENDNGAIDTVTKEWARIAHVANAAVELVHHVRKLNGAEVTVEDMRGAVALLATSRSARALARMTKIEGAKLGLEGEARRLFRFADAKNNLALPADLETTWFELASVSLGNGPGDGAERWVGGDSVGAVRRFAMPERAADVAEDAKARALGLVRAGEWRRDMRAGDAWIGVPVAQGLGLDLEDEADRARVKALVGEWIKGGSLREVTRKDAQRKPKTYVEAVAWTDETSGSAFD